MKVIFDVLIEVVYVYGKRLRIKIGLIDKEQDDESI
jgi:hypothetical protein